MQPISDVHVQTRRLIQAEQVRIFQQTHRTTYLLQRSVVEIHSRGANLDTYRAIPIFLLWSADAVVSVNLPLVEKGIGFFILEVCFLERIGGRWLDVEASIGKCFPYVVRDVFPGYFCALGGGQFGEVSEAGFGYVAMGLVRQEGADEAFDFDSES